MEIELTKSQFQALEVFKKNILHYESNIIIFYGSKNCGKKTVIYWLCDDMKMSLFEFNINLDEEISQCREALSVITTSMRLILIKNVDEIVPRKQNKIVKLTMLAKKNRNTVLVFVTSQGFYIKCSITIQMFIKQREFDEYNIKQKITTARSKTFLFDCLRSGELHSNQHEMYTLVENKSHDNFLQSFHNNMNRMHCESSDWLGINNLLSDFDVYSYDKESMLLCANQKSLQFVKKYEKCSKCKGIIQMNTSKKGNQYFICTICKSFKNVRNKKKASKFNNLPFQIENYHDLLANNELESIRKNIYEKIFQKKGGSSYVIQQKLKIYLKYYKQYSKKEQIDFIKRYKLNKREVQIFRLEKNYFKQQYSGTLITNF